MEAVSQVNRGWTDDTAPRQDAVTTQAVAVWGTAAGYQNGHRCYGLACQYGHCAPMPGGVLALWFQPSGWCLSHNEKPAAKFKYCSSGLSKLVSYHVYCCTHPYHDTSPLNCQQLQGKATQHKMHYTAAIHTMKGAWPYLCTSCFHT